VEKINGSLGELRALRGDSHRDFDMETTSTTKAKKWWWFIVIVIVIILNSSSSIS